MDGAGNLVVKVLTQHLRNLGSSPSWIQFFSACLVSQFVYVSKENIFIFVIYICILPMITFLSARLPSYCLLCPLLVSMPVSPHIGHFTPIAIS